MTKQPDRDARREADYRRLGTRTPKCAQCSEADPAALTGTHPDILCHEHRLASQGKPTTELDHMPGQHHGDFRVEVAANDHGVLSDLQCDWPERTLRNPDESPLRRIAAVLRKWLDVLRLLIERTVGRIPASLEWLDDLLRAALGERWWVTLGWSFEL